MINPYAVAVLTSFIFGFSFMFTKGALTATPSITGLLFTPR